MMQKFLDTLENIIKPKEKKLQKQTDDKYLYPNITDRMFAFNIDLIVLILVLMPLNNAGYFHSFASVFGLLAVYFIICTKKYNATIGKKILGIKVIDSITGKSISWAQSSIRFCCYLITFGPAALAITAFFSQGFIIFLISAVLTAIIIINFMKKKRALHDRLADTIVVFDKNRWYKRYFDRLKKYFNLK